MGKVEISAVSLGKQGKIYSKFFFSETIMMIELKVGKLAYDITLYKSYVFCQYPTAFVAMATKSSIDL